MRPQQVEFIEPVIAVYEDRFVTQSEVNWLGVELVGVAVAAIVVGAIQALMLGMLSEMVRQRRMA